MWFRKDQVRKEEHCIVRFGRKAGATLMWGGQRDRKETWAISLGEAVLRKTVFELEEGEREFRPEGVESVNDEGKSFSGTGGRRYHKKRPRW